MKDSKKEKEDVFFVGWDKKISPRYKKWILPFIVFVYTCILILIYTFVSHQKEFNDHHFEFSNIKTFKGTYYSSPAPILKLEKDFAKMLPKGTSPYLLLIGFGKYGAQPTMQGIEKKLKESLDGDLIEISGTLL